MWNLEFGIGNGIRRVELFGMFEHLALQIRIPHSEFLIPHS